LLSSSSRPSFSPKGLKSLDPIAFILQERLVSVLCRNPTVRLKSEVIKTLDDSWQVPCSLL
jgi:hypothetical protein